ncbi:MAG: Fe-S cluster assembly protein IscX, partial [Phycisphaeraceae bacterium]|nr:Fe-S cluster assembly protein IscX [Phycisphaeraceae bacterium]
VGVRFTELRELVENLDGFEPEPGQSPNEQILEAIQAGWIEEREDMKAADDDDDDGPGYQPNNPFR